MTHVTRLVRVTRRELAVANWFLLLMALIFALFVGWQGDQLKSQQWIYLMTIPGGKWSWATSFGILSIVGLYGQIRVCRPMVASGLFGTAVFCGFVSVCYLLAPIQDTSLKTGGWWPWIVAAAAFSGIGAVNTGDRRVLIPSPHDSPPALGNPQPCT